MKHNKACQTKEGFKEYKNPIHRTTY